MATGGDEDHHSNAGNYEMEIFGDWLCTHIYQSGKRCLGFQPGNAVSHSWLDYFDAQ